MSTPMTFRCPDCSYRWGPVGVSPFSPDAAEQQLLLLCQACGEPQVQMGASAQGLPCLECGEPRLVGLSRCPACGSEDAGWGP